MTILNELSGEVAVAVLARARNESPQDKVKLKEMLVNFYSALQSLKISSQRKRVRARAASATTSSQQNANEKS